MTSSTFRPLSCVCPAVYRHAQPSTHAICTSRECFLASHQLNSTPGCDLNHSFSAILFLPGRQAIRVLDGVQGDAAAVAIRAAEQRLAQFAAAAVATAEVDGAGPIAAERDEATARPLETREHDAEAEVVAKGVGVAQGDNEATPRASVTTGDGASDDRANLYQPSSSPPTRIWLDGAARARFCERQTLVLLCCATGWTARQVANEDGGLDAGVSETVRGTMTVGGRDTQSAVLLSSIERRLWRLARVDVLTVGSSADGIVGALSGASADVGHVQAELQPGAVRGTGTKTPCGPSVPSEVRSHLAVVETAIQELWVTANCGSAISPNDAKNGLSAGRGERAEAEGEKEAEAGRGGTVVVQDKPLHPPPQWPSPIHALFYEVLVEAALLYQLEFNEKVPPSPTSNETALASHSADSHFVQPALAAIRHALAVGEAEHSLAFLAVRHRVFLAGAAVARAPPAGSIFTPPADIALSGVPSLAAMFSQLQAAAADARRVIDEAERVAPLLDGGGVPQHVPVGGTRAGAFAATKACAPLIWQQVGATAMALLSDYRAFFGHCPTTSQSAQVTGSQEADAATQQSSRDEVEESAPLLPLESVGAAAELVVTCLPRSSKRWRPNAAPQNALGAVAVDAEDSAAALEVDAEAEAQDEAEAMRIAAADALRGAVGRSMKALFGRAVSRVDSVSTCAKVESKTAIEADAPSGVPSPEATLLTGETTTDTFGGVSGGDAQEWLRLVLQAVSRELSIEPKFSSQLRPWLPAASAEAAAALWRCVQPLLQATLLATPAVTATAVGMLGALQALRADLRSMGVSVQMGLEPIFGAWLAHIANRWQSAASVTAAAAIAQVAENTCVGECSGAMEASDQSMDDPFDMGDGSVDQDYVEDRLGDKGGQQPLGRREAWRQLLAPMVGRLRQDSGMLLRAAAMCDSETLEEWLRNGEGWAHFSWMDVLPALALAIPPHLHELTSLGRHLGLVLKLPGLGFLFCRARPAALPTDAKREHLSTTSPFPQHHPLPIALIGILQEMSVALSNFARSLHEAAERSHSSAIPSRHRSAVSPAAGRGSAFRFFIWEGDEWALASEPPSDVCGDGGSRPEHKVDVQPPPPPPPPSLLPPPPPANERFSPLAALSPPVTPLQALGAQPSAAVFVGQDERAPFCYPADPSLEHASLQLAQGIAGTRSRSSIDGGASFEMDAAGLAKFSGWLSLLDQASDSVREVALQTVVLGRGDDDEGKMPSDPTLEPAPAFPPTLDPIAPAAPGISLCRRALIGALVHRLVLCGATGDALDGTCESGPEEAVGDAVTHARETARAVANQMKDVHFETKRLTIEGLLTAMLLRCDRWCYDV